MDYVLIGVGAVVGYFIVVAIMVKFSSYESLVRYQFDEILKTKSGSLSLPVKEDIIAGCVELCKEQHRLSKNQILGFMRVYMNDLIDEELRQQKSA